MLKNNDLKSIYERVKNEMNLLDDDDKSGNFSTNHSINNSMSLRLSTEASVQLLRETMPQSYKLFYLLGCLPDGIKKEHLTKIWPYETDIEEGLRAFKELSFLEPMEDKICLTSFLVEFVQASID